MWPFESKPNVPVTRSRKLLTCAVGTVGALFLSVLGSGVWDRLGNPLVDWITRTIITVIGALIGTYKDSIYREASRGFSEYPASMLYGFLLTVIPVIAIVLVRRARRLRENPSLESRASRMSRLMLSRTFLYLFLLYALSFSAVAYSRQVYMRAIITYAESSLDRLAPHLTEAEEEELLAQFRSVQSAEDYYAFYRRLLETYEQHGLDHRSVPPL